MTDTTHGGLALMDPDTVAVRLQDERGVYIRTEEIPAADRLPDVLLWNDAEFVHVDGVVYRPGSRITKRGGCRVLLHDGPFNPRP